MRSAVISIGIDPELHVGPVTIAWHGLMLAVGIGVGLLLARHEAHGRGMSTQPMMVTWLVIALFGAGRFVEFFARSDSEDIALGINYAQWSSLLLVGAAALGAVVTWRYATRRPPRSHDL